MAEDLEEASSMEGTEIGEMWGILASLWSRRDYLSDALDDCLEAEIRLNHESLCDDYHIIEKTETHTSKRVYLEYIC